MTNQKTITREDLTQAIAKKIGLSATESRELVDSVFELIAEGLEREDIVKLASFGKFTKRAKAERIGRNPKTKEDAVIKARNVVTFTPSAILLKKMKRT